MTVSAQTPINIYTYAGSTTFVYSFQVLQAGDLVVSVNGVTKTLGSDYTQSGTGALNGGSIIYTSALTTGQVVTLRRSTALQRTNDYQSNGDFLAVTVNADFDRLWMAAQEYASILNQRPVRAPLGEVLNDLPAAAARANLLLSFDSSGQPVVVAPVAGTATALATALASTAGPNQIGFSYAYNYVVSTLGWSITHTYGIDVTQPPYNADSTGVADSSAAFRAVWAAFPGIPIHAPRGTYRMDTTCQFYVSTFPISVFGSGPKINGDGMGVTIFDNRVANGVMFDVDSTTGDAHATFKGVLGVEFVGFTVKTTTSPVVSSAIKLRTSYMAKLRQLHIIGMTGSGVTIQCSVGDNDGSNMVSLEQIRVENCLAWGLKFDCDSGRNETSFVHMSHVFVQACGTASGAATPPSGGMISKLQVMTMMQCAFTLNENCALFIPGQAGLASNYDLIDTTFENNKKRGLYCTGVNVFRGRNLQFYNNDTYTATNACEFDGAAFSVQNVDIDGVLVRATTGNNAHTAFKISGANAALDTCRVRRVSWANYDFAGQTRFSGWQFDFIPQCCDLVALTTTSVLFRPNQTIPHGNKSPLRLRGGAGGTPSAAGEWIVAEILNAGIGISNASLAASTRYYSYFYDNNGSPMLELSTTAFAIDTATGYPVKSSDATRLYVGSVETDAGSLFKLTAGGWLNPMLMPGSQVGVYNYTWADSTGRARIKYAAVPTTDTDGTVIGTQV